MRQNATSKAGSPNQAHSASRITGPCGPSRMFFGLTSPWTRATRVDAVRSASSYRRSATSGLRRAVTWKYGSIRSASKLSSVAKVPGTWGSAADTAWIWPITSPTWPASSGSTRPAMQLGLPRRRGRGRQELHGEEPGAGRSCAEQSRHAPGRCTAGEQQPGVLDRVARHRGMPLVGDAQCRQGGLHAEGPAREVDPPQVRGHSADERYPCCLLPRSLQALVEQEASARLPPGSRMSPGRRRRVGCGRRRERQALVLGDAQ